MMGEAEIKPSIQVVVSASMNNTSANNHTHPTDITKPSQLPILTKLHAGYFFICLSFGAQALLWKSLSQHNKDSQTLWHGFNVLPSIAFLLLWCLSVLIATTLSFLYMLKCILQFDMVKREFSHHIGVNCMYIPWISWLLMLQSAPVIVPRTCYYQVLCLAFSFVILLLDVKLYGQWFTTEKRFLSVVANPVSQVSVIGNLVAAQVIAEIGWKESAVSMFSLGLAHYLILFVTLYQRLTSSNQFPTVLRPAYFLFFAAPSVASVSWKSISGAFVTPSKMLFFLSLFLFMSQACRPALFKKSLKRLNVTWWVYSFPLTFLGLACVEYAQEVKGSMASGLMLVICVVSVLVFIVLMVVTLLKIERLLHANDPIMS
ncbi:S-type anion channel SLAH1-like [Gastrolobium bilobum]|uniref:S-type anion channel SLAH1-like n=1 Tax=Gastrolobium bilobum TaxID=150636 RepID=UPI002AB309C0|nr:S-type anion channel SLAH1-like [Gastrolobium bilobum]